MNDFIKRTIYWTIVFGDNERNRWKINANFENKRKFFFNDWKKRTKPNDEQTKWKHSNVSISSYKWISY